MTARFKIIAVFLLFLLPFASKVHPAGVVGTGTPESCDTAALLAALAGGGLVTFNCGGAATITLDETLTINATTTIDGTNNIILSGGGVRRLLQHTGGTLTLRNLTITGGFASGANTAANGAAIRSVAQGVPLTLNIENVNFADNVSTLTSFSGNAYDFGGGAIFTQGGYLNVTGSTFTNNHANNGAGGAIHGLRSDVVIGGSTFTTNSAVGEGQGGALYFDGARPDNGIISISDSVFTGNTTHNQGGAIYVHLYQNNDAFTVNESTFVDNAVIGGDIGLGGAISGGNGRVTISNSLFADNRVARPEGADGFLDGSGGALAFAERAQITIANSTFNGNRAEGLSTNANGGAIYIVNNTQQFSIINSTIAGNFAGWVGGGISSTNNGVLRNTIIAHNVAENGPNDWGIQQQCSARLANGGNNIQYPDRNPNPNFFNEVVCANGIRIEDPLLEPLADNGGPTRTMALEFGSPAIDLGSNPVCASTAVNNRDQRGEERPSDGNGNGNPVCEIGACEYYHDEPPFAPILLAPAAGASITNTALTFSWQGAPFADEYRLQVDNNAGFPSPEFDITLEATSYTPDILLPGTYFWRLQALNINGTTTSQTRTFTIISAANAAPMRNLYDTPTPTLTWGAVEWAAGYQIQIADNANFTTPITSSALDAATLAFTPAAPLADGVYYWRVRARRANGSWGNWSAAETFIVLVPG